MEIFARGGRDKRVMDIKENQIAGYIQIFLSNVETSMELVGGVVFHC